MNSFGQILSFGIGALFLGVALTLGLIGALVSRTDTDKVEGCLGLVFFLVPLALAVGFFIAAW